MTNSDTEKQTALWKKLGISSAKQATDEGLLALSVCPELLELNRFSLIGFENAFAPRAIGFRALVHSPYFAHIKELSFTSVYFNHDSFAALLDSPSISSWKTLILFHSLLLLQSTSSLEKGTTTSFNQPGLLSMLARAPLSSLTCLSLSSNGLNSQDLQQLVNSHYLQNLEVLDLSKNDIGNEGIKALCASSFPRLKKLSLEGNLLSVASAQTLLSWPQLDQLEFLNLYQNSIFEEEQHAYDQGALLFSSPPDEEALELRARLGSRLKI